MLHPSRRYGQRLVYWSFFTKQGFWITWALGLIVNAGLFLWNYQNGGWPGVVDVLPPLALMLVIWIVRAREFIAWYPMYQRLMQRFNAHAHRLWVCPACGHEYFGTQEYPGACIVDHTPLRPFDHVRDRIFARRA